MLNIPETRKVGLQRYLVNFDLASIVSVHYYRWKEPQLVPAIPAITSEVWLREALL